MRKMEQPNSDTDHWRARRLRKRIEDRRRASEEANAQQETGKTHTRSVMTLQALQVARYVFHFCCLVTSSV